MAVRQTESNKTERKKPEEAERMILKYKTIFEFGHSEDKPAEVKVDRWEYIDGITECGVYFDPNEKCTMFAYNESGCDIILALHDEAYLINDAGKTIEKIAY